MTSPRVILITGANRGIGYSIAQALGTASPDDILLIASRSKTNAEVAIDQLRKDAGIESRMYPVQINVTDNATIEIAQNWIEHEFGHLDGSLKT